MKSDTPVGNVLSAPLTGLLPSTPYYYRVRGFNASGTEPEFQPRDGHDASSPPGSPCSKAGHACHRDRIPRELESVAGASGYRIDVSADIAFGSFVGAYRNFAVTDTGLVVTSLSPGTSYYYRVRAENAGGTSGNSAAVALATIPPAPLAASGVAVSKTGFTAAWNAAAGATGYRLDVASDSLFFTGVVESDSSAGAALSAPVTGLKSGTTYYYRVRAFNPWGTSGNSNRISVTTLPDPPPPAPRAKRVRDHGNRIHRAVGLICGGDRVQA